MADWQNRIIRLEHIPANQLMAHPHNARRHPAKQREALRGSLDTLGWYDAVIYNQRTGYLIDGHARVEEQLTRDENATIPALVVDLTEAEEAQALASHDWITQLAEYDKTSLDTLLSKAVSDDERVQEMLQDMANTIDAIEFDDNPLTEKYSRKIESPHYEISGEKPALSELFDNSKTTALIAQIDDSDVPDDIKHFLRIAAQRHTQLRFDKIAEFYAHADTEIQNLMEQSALVIIDFNQAIELGFVKITNDLAQLFAEENNE